jgi:GT2 family glycosyltransferase
MNDLFTASIVLYNNDRDILLKAINSFLNTQLNVLLFLVDNSIKDDLRDIIYHDKVVYIHNPNNPGFGASHNIAIRQSIDKVVDYHIIVNPDIYFNEDIITPMLDFMLQNHKVGMMMPQILNEDGSLQNLPKLLPSPFSIFMRKLKIPSYYYNKFISQYELRDAPKDLIYNAPVLSGCFTLLNLIAIKDVGMYDDSFFMYFEDWDLSRRVHKKYKTIYYPLVSVYHSYESGANKNIKLFKIFLKSAITYFNKWGWFFDKERKLINTKALFQFK